MFLDVRPLLNLSCIGKQHADDGTFFGSLFDRKQRFAGNPTVGNSFVKSFACALTYNNVEAVVTQIACLTGTLNAITDNGDGFIFEHFACFFQWKFFTGSYLFDSSTKINFAILLKMFKQPDAASYTYYELFSSGLMGANVTAQWQIVSPSADVARPTFFLMMTKESLGVTACE